MHTSKKIPKIAYLKVHSFKEFSKNYISQIFSVTIQKCILTKNYTTEGCIAQGIAVLTLLNSKHFYKKILLLIHNYSYSIFLAELHCQRLYSSVEMKVDLNNSLGIGISNFSCRFLKAILNLNGYISKTVLTFHCFEWIDLVISKYF